MVSVIITAFKEPVTIRKAINCIANSEFSSLPVDSEIIQISPDEETLKAGADEAHKLKLKNFRQLIDPHKGKPTALNMAFKEAKGKILILTDGDVSFTKGSAAEILKPFNDATIGGVTGQPVPSNDKSTYWGYLAHCFTAAADHKRKASFTHKQDEYYVSDGKFFPLSGYIFAIRNLNLSLPNGLAIDDSYISYSVFNKNFKLAYAPNAQAIVKFPTNYTDYIKQRRRNLAGHIEMAKYKELGGYTNERSFKEELKYALFPLRYASNIKEFAWSLTMYPLRILTWLTVLKMRLTSTPIMGRSGWTRVESTKG